MTDRQTDRRTPDELYIELNIIHPTQNIEKKHCVTWFKVVNLLAKVHTTDISHGVARQKIKITNSKTVRSLLT